jgi:integrase
MSCFVYRPSRKKGNKSVKSKLYSGRFTVGHELKVYNVALRAADKQVARQLVEKIRKEYEQELAGLIPSRTIRESARRPLNDLFDAFVLAKDGLGRDARYLLQLKAQLQRLSMDCGWQVVGNITAVSFDKWRAGSFVSPKTKNSYLNAISSFCSWLVQTHQLADNPMRFVERMKTTGRATYERRSLSLPELKRLIAVSGDRAPVYIVAAFTGLRRQELMLLEWRDVNLGSASPFIKLRAETTKSNKGADVPLHPDVQAALLSIRPSTASPKSRVFPSMIPRIPRFNKDLAAAEIAVIDEASRKVHFHSLRHTFCTLLQVWGASRQEAQRLMRHSDARLTEQVYTDLNQLPLGPAVQRLPSIMGDLPATERNRSRNL